ncbi:siderophore-interacting protein [Kineococcus glutinatus]|uniref:FAD-binding FR-type domain-containing protein n=1 Tax=Kineococcus glutinatus TaxID=1070872 RepID=A0ABP9H992_9ACTN
MSTTTASSTTAVDPAYRPLVLRVARRERLSPSFLRLTLTGDDLATFGAGGWDQRVKLVPPRAGVSWHGTGPGWYEWWLSLPDAQRPPMRTYTVRACRPQLREIDVDFVLHGVDGHDAGPAGPAASWAATAAPGDEITVIGPSAPGSGRMWGVEFAPPPTARTLLMAGDETAVPAVCSVLEALPAGVRVAALLEVPTAADVLAPVTAADAEVVWLPREGAAHGELLCAAVRERTAALVQAPAAAGPVALEDVDVDAQILWEVPEAAATCGPEDLYAWLAGEAAVVKELRRHLVRDLGVPRQCVAFMGYWRRGRSEGA